MCHRTSPAGPNFAARLAAFAVVFLSLFVTSVARAQGPLEPSQVPEPLRPWTEWALRGKGDRCPALDGADPRTAVCVWPTALSLSLGDKGGTFEQHWHVDARRAVPLPGDDKRWPLDVRLGNARAIVIAQGGVPTVELEPGDHVVRGSFAWDSLPESLRVPPETALLSLSLRGQRVGSPHRDPSGTLWLQKTVAQEDGERLDFVVHRRVIDDVPLLLTTRIVLSVSGKSREVLLGRALPPGFVPLELKSELPARLEADSRVRIQLRPGTWTVEIVARSTGPVEELRRPDPGGPWRTGDEVWVFDARTYLRLVEVSGLSSVDPAQTSLPEEWKRLPAYTVPEGGAMKLTVRRRGDADPPPDPLTLERTLWLDFDGRGFTVSDAIGGSLRRASRLEMLPPAVLGRVAVDGRDQFITHLDAEPGKVGVEVRQGTLDVRADSRLVAAPSDMPAVSWNHDFRSVSATLNLPPGYRLVHASGVDDVPTTWLKHWTLLELFVVLVLSVATLRLFGPRWAALALVAWVLLFPERDAPTYVFVAVVVCEALVRACEGALKKAPLSTSRGLHRARSIVLVLRALSVGVLVLLAVPFMIAHVRHGAFPVLGEDAGRVGEGLFAEEREGGAGRTRPLEVAAGAPAPPAVQAPAEDEATDDDAKAAAASSVATAPSPAKEPQAPLGIGSLSRKSKDAYRQFNADVYDPSAVVQTGPGLPRWTFESVPLRFSGPVERAQRMHLYLLSPRVNFALALLRVALLAALIARFLPVRPRRTKGDKGRTVLTFAAATVLACLAFPRAARADVVPPKEVLDELASRLLERPSCAPNCASSSRAVLDATPSNLTLRMEVDARAAAAVPLPTSTQWSPETVLVDGHPASALARSDGGKLWVSVARGSHQIVLAGPIAEREVVQLAFPLRPHRLEAHGSGFRVDGLHEDGLADDSVQLTRIRNEVSASAPEAEALPPFVRVERTLSFGLDWQVETKVSRLSPKGAPVVLSVPLLPGESVTTPDVRVEGGKAQLNLSPQAEEVRWRSVLAQRSPVTLTAPPVTAWTELWRLDLSPIWHAALEGVPVIHADPSATQPEWRPWPGEVATIVVSKPEGALGSTLTLDATRYEVRPGLRTTDASLDVQLRSSRGGEHAFSLPEGALLESVTIDGATQPIRQDGRRVVVPITPGQAHVVVKWRVPSGITSVFRPAPVDLGAPSVNATIVVEVPSNRWVLGLAGPYVGPVVLFWSLLAVLLVVATAIGWMRRTPLSILEWMLLAVGLSQVDVLCGAIVVGWLHLLAWRERSELPRRSFNLRQLAVVAVTLVALGILVASVHQGLLGRPEMQIRGNGSSAGQLAWFVDRADSALPSPLVVSVPMVAYRALMLVWALWLALAVVRWLRWGFGAFGTGGFWRAPAVGLAPLHVAGPQPAYAPAPSAEASAGVAGEPPPTAPPPNDEGPAGDER